MASSQMERVVQCIREAVAPRDGGDQSDAQLLEGFIARQDQEAFGAIVRRHGPMVLGVCRRLLPRHQDAEDAFQATFLVLVRKASTVQPREMLVNWLYGVACNTALKARAATAKRQAREKQVMAMPEPETAPSPLTDELRPMLDQELSRLPDIYRVPIVSCDLEGKTREEAARQLGWSEGTLSGRLFRAREMLAKRLSQRGVVLSAGALAAALSQETASASVPTSLTAATIQAAGLFSAGQVVSTEVAVLTQGVLNGMFVSKLKVAALVLAAVGLLSIAGAGLAYRMQSATGTPPANDPGRLIAQNRQGEQPPVDPAPADEPEPIVEPLEGLAPPGGAVPPAKVAIGEPAPAFKITDHTGKALDLAELTARGPVLVRLTCAASTCGCNNELPYFQAIHHAYKDQGLTCLFIFRSPDTLLAKYAQDKQLDMLYAADPKGLSWNTFQTKSMPTNILIEQGGKISAIAAGCDPSGILANKMSEKAARLVGMESVDVKAMVEETKATK